MRRPRVIVATQNQRWTMTRPNRVLQAMRGEPVDQIPVMCQMSIGHILLNTGVDPVSFNFTNEGYVGALLEARDRYDFDGILVHKPGREEAWLDTASSKSVSEDCICYRWEDGSVLDLPSNDDPRFRPPAEWDPPAIETVDVSNLAGTTPETVLGFWRHKGLIYWNRPEETPKYYFDALRRIISSAPEGVSIHGEIKAPSDCVLNLLGMEGAMMGFVLEPRRMHDLLEAFTVRLLIWARQQIEMGVDAIKVSSPYAGGGFISKEYYDTFIVPYERAIASGIHEAGGIAYTHTCGAIGDRLPEMVGTGVDGIECLDPPPLGNVELADAKREFGDRIFIKGNVDAVNTLLRKGIPDIRHDVQKVVETGAPGGRFILSTACSIAPAVPPEHIREMVDVGRDHPVG